MYCNVHALDQSAMERLEMFLSKTFGLVVTFWCSICETSIKINEMNANWLNTTKTTTTEEGKFSIKTTFDTSPNIATIIYKGLYLSRSRDSGNDMSFPETASLFLGRILVERLKTRLVSSHFRQKYFKSVLETNKRDIS